MAAATTATASYIVVGAGVFGAATAVQLKTHRPNAHVVVLDRSPTPNAPSTDAASSDLNKIIRADYANDAFRALAARALDRWRTDPLLRPFYHEVGLLLHSLPGNQHHAEAAWQVAARGVDEAHALASASQEGEDAAEASSSLPPLAYLCNSQEDLDGALPEHARKVKGSSLAAIGRSHKENQAVAYFNPRAGWAAAREATCAVLQRAADLGVEFVPNAHVVQLLLAPSTRGKEQEADQQQTVRGVRTADGRELVLEDADAGAVFLCTGSWTPALLPSLIDLDHLSSPFPAPPVVYSAQTVLLIEVPEDLARRHASVPVVLNFDTGFYCFEPRFVPSSSSSSLRVSASEHGDQGQGQGRWLVKCAIHDRGYQSPAPPSSSSSSHPLPPASSSGSQAYPSFRPDTATSAASTGKGAPPTASSTARAHVPEAHEGRMLEALRGVWPELVERGTVHESRICWYAETTDENWLIDAPPSLPNLILATGDSGHAFKFLPLLGDLVLARLAGLRRRWVEGVPALGAHWERVFSWGHHVAQREKEEEGAGVKQAAAVAEWQPHRDPSSSKVLVSLHHNGIDNGANGAVILDTSRTL